MDVYLIICKISNDWYTTVDPMGTHQMAVISKRTTKTYEKQLIYKHIDGQLYSNHYRSMKWGGHVLYYVYNQNSLLPNFVPRRNISNGSYFKDDRQTYENQRIYKHINGQLYCNHDRNMECGGHILQYMQNSLLHNVETNGNILNGRHFQDGR